jgi:ribosomal subunit interface protein
MIEGLDFKITFRNLQPSDALSEAIKKRLGPIFRKFSNRPLIVNAILKKTTLCFMEVSVHFPNFTLVASSEDKDFYLLIDKIKGIIREQLRRHKEKLRDK